MEMTNEKIAKKMVPALVKKMFPDLKNVTGLIAILASNILKYGYYSKKIVTDERIQAFKEFLPYAEKFFNNLNDTVKMSIELNDKHYSRIIDCILQHETVSFEEKIKAYVVLEELRIIKQKTHMYTLAAAVVSTLLGGGAISATYKVNTNESYNSRKAKEAKYKYKYKHK